ncbi:hypothetical protein P691DRAFT_295137 [Macrolepiota fuliginosa MF-IS2]|uniref:Uncharacterized protein n=1 Tax=Macrolepiota fuliginosa MF-IS2 TaxID=1400762 RepID=A0A9P6C886_9AGAR|nr:hypothetical protein P691DRAFT_295137 [Macrolepiota fuliginosa MF-IS2]
MLVITCAGFLYRQIKDPTVDHSRYRWSIFSLGYTLLMFGFATTSMVLEAIVVERAFVQFRGVLGGPSLYLYEIVFGHVKTLSVVYVILIACHYCATGLLVSYLDFSPPKSLS